MQKFDVTQVDLGISEFDASLGELWSDHCMNPITSLVVGEDGSIILIGKYGDFRGKATEELLLSLGEEC